jgi:predicted nucleotidyltransferase component of viral defense system
MALSTALVFSPAQDKHVAIMQAIAQDLRDLPMVLKGGTALLLCYGLDRFSEDLDFDAPKKFNIAGRVEKVLSRLTDDFDIKTVKDTATVQRLKIHYRSQAVGRLLKIETSFRQVAETTPSIEVNGIKTYPAHALIDQKIAALLGRTKARDLFDVCFLARNYPNEFSPKAKQQLAEQLQDLNALESRYRPAFVDDGILTAEQLPELVLQLNELVAL